jgi:hypothetical protein
MTGAIIVLALTHAHGPGLSVDSVNYLAAAESIWTSRGVNGFIAGDHLADFPPLYSLLLVPGEALGDPLAGARMVGAASLFLLVAIAVVGSSRIAPGFAFPAATGIAVVISYPAAGVSSFVWSDAPFAACVAAFLIAASSIGERRHAVLACGVLAGVATLARYLGVTTIPIGVLAIWVWSERRRRDLPLFLVLATIGPALWVVRNLVVTSTFAGDRHAASDNLGSAIRATTFTIGTWIDADHPQIGLAIIAVLGTVLLGGVRRLPLARLELVAFTFGVVYAAWLAFSAATISLDPIDDRFLAPLFVPVAWLVVGITRRLFALGEERFGRWPTVAGLVVLAVVWAVAQGSRLPRLAADVEQSSLAHIPRLEASEKRLAERISPQIYSNAPHAVYLRTGTRVSYSPRSARYRSDERIDEIGPLRDRLAAEGRAVLIWFRQVDSPSVYTPAELAKYFRLRLLAEATNAALYVLCPPRSAAKAC